MSEEQEYLLAPSIESAAAVDPSIDVQETAIVNAAIRIQSAVRGWLVFNRTRKHLHEKAMFELRQLRYEKKQRQDEKNKDLTMKIMRTPRIKEPDIFPDNAGKKRIAYTTLHTKNTVARSIYEETVAIDMDRMQSRTKLTQPNRFITSEKSSASPYEAMDITETLRVENGKLIELLHLDNKILDKLMKAIHSSDEVLQKQFDESLLKKGLAMAKADVKESNELPVFDKSHNAMELKKMIIRSLAKEVETENLVSSIVNKMKSKGKSVTINEDILLIEPHDRKSFEDATTAQRGSAGLRRKQHDRKSKDASKIDVGLGQAKSSSPNRFNKIFPIPETVAIDADFDMDMYLSLDRYSNDGDDDDEDDDSISTSVSDFQADLESQDDSVASKQSTPSFVFDSDSDDETDNLPMSIPMLIHRYYSNNINNNSDDNNSNNSNNSKRKDKLANGKGSNLSLKLSKPEGGVTEPTPTKQPTIGSVSDTDAVADSLLLTQINTEKEKEQETKRKKKRDKKRDKTKDKNKDKEIASDKVKDKDVPPPVLVDEEREKEKRNLRKDKQRQLESRSIEFYDTRNSFEPATHVKEMTMRPYIYRLFEPPMSTIDLPGDINSNHSNATQAESPWSHMDDTTSRALKTPENILERIKLYDIDNNPGVKSVSRGEEESTLSQFNASYTLSDVITGKQQRRHLESLASSADLEHQQWLQELQAKSTEMKDVDKNSAGKFVNQEILRSDTMALTLVNRHGVLSDEVKLAMGIKVQKPRAVFGEAYLHQMQQMQQQEQEQEQHQMEQPQHQQEIQQMQQMQPKQGISLDAILQLCKEHFYEQEVHLDVDVEESPVDDANSLIDQQQQTDIFPVANNSTVSKLSPIVSFMAPTKSVLMQREEKKRILLEKSKRQAAKERRRLSRPIGVSNSSHSGQLSMKQLPLRKEADSPEKIEANPILTSSTATSPTSFKKSTTTLWKLQQQQQRQESAAAVADAGGYAEVLMELKAGVASLLLELALDPQSSSSSLLHTRLNRMTNQIQVFEAALSREQRRPLELSIDSSSNSSDREAAHLMVVDEDGRARRLSEKGVIQMDHLRDCIILASTSTSTSAATNQSLHGISSVVHRGVDCYEFYVPPAVDVETNEQPTEINPVDASSDAVIQQLTNKVSNKGMRSTKNAEEEEQQRQRESRKEYYQALRAEKQLMKNQEQQAIRETYREAQRLKQVAMNPAGHSTTSGSSPTAAKLLATKNRSPIDSPPQAAHLFALAAPTKIKPASEATEDPTSVIGAPAKPSQPKPSQLLQTHPKNKNVRFTESNHSRTAIDKNSSMKQQQQQRRQNRHRYMESTSNKLRMSTAPETLPQQHQMLFVPTGLRLLSNVLSR